MKPELSSLWKQSRRRLPFALLASSLAVGCGQPAPESSETPAPSAPQAESSAQAVAPSGNLEVALNTAATNEEEDAVPERPVVESLFAIPQGAASKVTASVFELKLDAKREQNEQFRGKTLTMLDGTQQLLFRDDGQGGDAVAGDLLFVATGTFDFVALQAEQQRITQAQSQSQEPLTTAVFEGRELVRTVPVSALSTQFPAGQRVPIRPIGLATLVDPARSLLIRAPSVVNDVGRTWDPCTNVGNPNGKWTFNYLMTEMANQPFTGVAPSTFVREWLRQWEAAKVVNGFTTPPRTNIVTKLINPWPKVGGALDLTKSPFKLVAIVNRLDLAGNNPAYGSGRAGEGRFIFAATEGTGSSCHTVPFLVILEYGVDKNDCVSIKTYAQQWQALSTMALGSATYNAALEALTEQFAKRDLSPRKPNRSSINQVRTNDFWLASPWELRESRLWNNSINPASFAAPGPVLGLLNSHTVAQTPDRATKNTLFPAYVNANVPPIVAVPPTYTVPLAWSSGAFRGGRAIVTSPSAIPPFWSQPATVIPNRQARHVFSLNTCDGCHGDELGTPFTHVNQNGALSPFLSGLLTVPDRADGSPTRTFNEMLGRQTFLDQVANQSCLTLSFLSSSAAVH